MIVNIIGAGLAGCEAAFQLSKRNIKVNLFEIKRIKKNEIQKLDYFGELVCSNTLRSIDLKNAVGTLKDEMNNFNSLILKAANASKIPAGQSLAVDRIEFAKYITDFISKDKNITVIDKEVTKIDKSIPTIIATGPLTSWEMQKEISKLIGKEYFYFFDAVAPIIKKSSINTDVVFRKNRYEKGETQDYLNCPMNKEQYDIFYTNLINAKEHDSHLENEKNLNFFDGCMPIEAMAKRGEQTMKFGPLKPAGLRNLDGSPNYAVVQLRQDNASDDLYNMVGFQTNLKFAEQKRVFQLIPGLENAEFVRYGVMHQNNYINSPALLNKGLQLINEPNIFFAGQITGVEGYVESAGSAIIAAINIERFLNKKEILEFPIDTVMGGLINYITSTSSINFQPMKANWSIVSDFINLPRMSKLEKKETYSKRAIVSMKTFVSLYDLV